MYRFLLRPKWIGFHLLVIAGIVAMVNLGFWQLRRLDDKRSFNAVVESRYDQPVVPLDELLVDGAEPEDLEWRPVVVSGVYEPEGTIRIVNRSQYGFAGENIVTPMRLDDGRILLVNRGFERLGVDPPPPPSGRVTVDGRLRPSQEKGFGQLADPAEGVLDVAQRVDIERLSQQLDGEVVPMYVDVDESRPAEADPAPQPVIAPTLDEGPHLSYAVQWFIFSIAVAVGWVLAVRRSVATRRRERAGHGPADGQADRPGGPGVPAADVDEPADDPISPAAPRSAG